MRAVPQPAASSPTAAAVTPPAPAAQVTAGKAVMPTEQQMVTVINQLDSRRSTAFADADRSLLDQVYSPGSAPLLADRRRLAVMVAAGQHAQGLALRVGTVDMVSAAPFSVLVRVADELDSYTLRSAGGAVVARLPGRPLTTWSIRLVRRSAQDDWRIQAITRA